jgi:hypothetical protein
VKITLSVLNTERTRRINHGAKFEGVSIRQDAMLLKDLGDDLGHAALLENPLVASVRKVSQAGRQGQVIARGAPTWVIPANGVDLPMQTVVRFAESQVGGLVEQRFQIKGRVFADHLYVNEKRLIEDFTAFECQDLQVDIYMWKNQIET